MDVVAHVIAIGENPATWTNGQGKGEAALIIIAARVHPRLHQAFAYLVRIKELGEMPYQIEIHRLSNSLFPKCAQFWCVHGNYPIATLHATKKLRTKATRFTGCGTPVFEEYRLHGCGKLGFWLGRGNYPRRKRYVLIMGAFTGCGKTQSSEGVGLEPVHKTSKIIWPLGPCVFFISL
jgi:hypothetical protein